MKNVLLVQLPAEGEVVLLPEETVHHLVHVRRMQQGAHITAVDGQGGRCRIEIQQRDDDSWIAIGLERLSSRSPSGGDLPPLSMYIALLKGKKGDTVVRALTELGVSRIVPVTTRRTVVRGDETGGGRLLRWDRIIAEACEQSGRADRPELRGPMPFGAMLKDYREQAGSIPGSALVFHEAATLPFDIADPVPVIAAAIGPEGGFAPEELQQAENHGWRPARLATPVLRADTAAIAATALVQHQRSHYNRSIFGSERSEWPVP